MLHCKCVKLVFKKKGKHTNKQKKPQKLVIMNKSDKSSHKSIDFTETTHVRKNQAEYTSIANYLFARCRIRIKRKIFKTDFSKVHGVHSSPTNSWEHSHVGKTKGWGGEVTWKAIYLVKKIKGKKTGSSIILFIEMPHTGDEI